MAGYDSKTKTWESSSNPSPAQGASLLEGIAVGIYSVDNNGLCTQINSTAARLLGYSETECLGRNMHELVHFKYPNGDPFPVRDCPLVQTPETRVPVYNLRETMWRKSGEAVQVACSSVPMYVDGTFQATIITLIELRTTEVALQAEEEQHREALRQRDVTARIEIDMAAEIARRQREATLALERAATSEIREQQRLIEDRLIKSERMASLGLLAASISHEINNPLEAVTNLLYLVRNDASLSAESLNYLHMAEEELSRVTEIVAKTLSFQRGTVTPVECSPEKLVDSVIALYQGKLRYASIAIQRDHRRSQPFLCPEGDIRQVLNNLVSNAVDAMRSSGGGKLTIRTQPSRGGKDNQPGTRFTISDTGAGMSQTTAARIFDSLFTTKGNSGSGIGLSLASSIVRRHGGTLKVRSAQSGPHCGTTFSLFLPHMAAQPAKGETVQ